MALGFNHNNNGIDYSCYSNKISGSRVTAYSSSYFNDPNRTWPWSDGLSISCENMLVESNEIVDATDAAIVVYTAVPGADACPQGTESLSNCPQSSIVRNNLILSAGNSAYWGLGADGLTGATDTRSRSFAGSSFTGNVIFSGPRTQIDTVLAVGTRSLWGVTANTHARHATFVNNTSGGGSVRGGIGLAVSGMLNATTHGNDLTFVKVSGLFKSACTELASGADSVASVTSNFASGNLQLYVDMNLTAPDGTGCVCVKTAVTTCPI
jgi:hypothetical protein